MLPKINATQLDCLQIETFNLNQHCFCWVLDKFGLKTLEVSEILKVNAESALPNFTPT